MNPDSRVKNGNCGEKADERVKGMIKRGLASSKWMGIAVVCGALASCAAGPQAPSPKPPVTGTPAPAPETGPIAYKSSGHAAMDAWRNDFSARAMAAGNDRALVKSLLENISPIRMWLGSSETEVKTQTAPSDQAEFAKPIWDYLATPLGNTRITQGQQKLASTSATLTAIEARYGVDRQALLAIWGMETNFGGFIGRDDAANALANMAVEGRRRNLAETELYALMKILKDGDARRGDLIAGWAGAMGHTQFMPSTYVAHAVDFDGDGRKDVWKSEADALASAANYLARSGYVKGQPWGIEVLTPEGFDYGLADGNERRMTTWTSAGLSPIRGGAFDTGGAEYAELWLPAGASGPKFLLFKNFNVYKTYNRADSYALAVGLSGDMIAGKGGRVAAWPKHLPPLTVADIRELQTSLNELGYDAGTPDGIAGRRTKTALQNFQKARGFLADGYPTQEMLAAVRAGGPAIN